MGSGIQFEELGGTRRLYFDLNKEASNRAVHFGSGTNHHQPWYPVGETPHMKVVGMFVVSLKRCKFRILVSIRVFWAKRHHVKP